MVKFAYCLYKSFYKTIDDDGVEHAGYMSFMILLSFFPFIVFFLALTAFFGASELGEQFVKIFLNSMPKDATIAIEARVQEILKAPPQSLMTLAIFGSIWTASSFVEGLRTILNRIYEVSTPPAYIWRRFLSITQFLAISIMISIVMFLLVIIPFILNKIPAFKDLLSTISPVINYLRYGIIFLAVFFTVSALYYVIPNTKLNFTSVFPGALMTSILWILTGFFISKYIIYYNQLSLIYGSLGSIIVTLLFFYVINMVFIYGAAFNHLYNKKK
jgi:membrane protein